MSGTADDLAAISLFASLSESDRRVLAGWFDAQTAGAGVRLVGEGAAGYSFFVLVEGSAVVTSAGAELATLGPGDFFGEIAILGDGRRTATVTTTAPAKLLVMFGTEFRRLEQEHPEIAARVSAAMRERLATPPAAGA
jgi:CRP-like cAMP-binding protein